MKVDARVGGFEGRAGARIAWVLCTAGGLLAVPSLLVLPTRGGPLAGFAVLAAHLLASGAALHLVDWDRHGRRWLLVWPLWVLVLLAFGGSVLFEDGAGPLSGFVVLAYIYVGITQPRGTSVLLLPVAVPCWFAMQGTVDVEVWLRIPVATGVWVVAAETIAWLRTKVEDQVRSLEVDASTDPLTGLANRRGLPAALAAVRDGDALVMVDLDHFKAVNDRLGHQAGDRVLRRLGHSVLARLGASDVAFRLGGEEVLLVLPGARAGGAGALVDRLRRDWDGLEPGVTFSAGVAVAEDGRDGTAVLAAADAALYRAKADGRACWRLAGDADAVGDASHAR